MKVNSPKSKEQKEEDKLTEEYNNSPNKVGFLKMSLYEKLEEHCSKYNKYYLFVSEGHQRNLLKFYKFK
jgi:hypothetical protein